MIRLNNLSPSYSLRTFSISSYCRCWCRCRCEPYSVTNVYTALSTLCVSVLGISYMYVCQTWQTCDWIFNTVSWTPSPIELYNRWWRILEITSKWKLISQTNHDYNCDDGNHKNKTLDDFAYLACQSINLLHFFWQQPKRNSIIMSNVISYPLNISYNISLRIEFFHICKSTNHFILYK